MKADRQTNCDQAVEPRVAATYFGAACHDQLARRHAAEPTGDFLLPDSPVRLSRPIQAVGPTLEVAVSTRWLAQATARARAHG
jgi:hypothetical protein